MNTKYVPAHRSTAGESLDVNLSSMLVAGRGKKREKKSQGFIDSKWKFGFVASFLPCDVPLMECDTEKNAEEGSVTGNP